MSVFFDDFDSGIIENDQLPFEVFEKKDNEAETLAWLTNDITAKLQEAEGRVRNFRRNYRIFKNIHYFDNQSRNSNDENRDNAPSLKSPKMVINFIQEMVETKISQRTRYKPSVAYIPHNDEIEDINNSQTAKLLVDHRLSEVEIEDLLSLCDKYAFLGGEGYLFVEWDQDAGPVSPVVEQYKDKIKKEVKIGDVCYSARGVNKVFKELGKTRHEDINQITAIDYVHVDVLKKMYPKKAEQITATQNYFAETDSFDDKKILNHAMFCRFWHRPTKLYPEGCYIEFCDGAILKYSKKYPYEHGKLPIITFTDIDVLDELYARPFVDYVIQAQRHHNFLTSSILRNHALVSAPKWLMPKGTCKVNQLNNDITIVEYTGAVPPRLAVPATTGGEIYSYQDKLENYIGKMSGVYGVSRGEPPTGVTASVAMQFLDEQEQQRESNSIRKRNRNIRKLHELTLSVMQQFYSPTDGRMVKILGKDNEYMIRSFEQADFNFNCSVRVMNVSSLPDSKAGRLQSIIDLNMSTAQDPIFKKEEIIQMLDLGTDETFKNEATVSLKAAQTIYDDIISGREVPQIEPYDDLLLHYRYFMRKLRSRTFKEKLPSDIQQKLIKRVMVTEGLIWDKMQRNQKFAMEVSTIDYYPVFFSIPIPVPMPMMEQQQPEQQPQIGGMTDEQPTTATPIE